LQRCVRSVISAGFSPIVFAEPGTDIEGLPCAVVTRQSRLGIWRNYVQTLVDLLESYPSAQAILVLQDDVVLCKDVREFLEHDLWPGQNPGMVSIYCPEEKEAGGVPGCDRRVSTVIGLCAAVYPRAAAEAIVASPFASDWRGRHDKNSYEPDPLKKKAIDTGVCETLKSLGLAVYNYRPSMAQHIAETSAIGHGGSSQVRPGNGMMYRQSRHFIGEDRSPFDVFPRPWVRYSLPKVKQRYRAVPAQPTPLRVTVVIPGYGCEDLTVRCLWSLNTHAAGVVQEVIYVDNGSPSGTVEAVEEAASGGIPLRVIRNQENLGFSHACNQGIEAASRDTHVLLLNTDAFVGSECVQRLSWHANHHERVAAVGPVTGDDGAQSIRRQDVRKASRYNGDVDADRYNLETASALQRAYAYPSDVLSGFCMLMTRPAINEFGLLREDGALASGLGADDEWCLRAHRAGWINLVVCNAWCVHLHKSTFRRAGIDRDSLQRDAVRQLHAEGVL
jgi:GT2 family glycosyltransferase